MNTDNIYSVLPGEGGDDEEDALRHPETPSQPTRQGLAGERSPNVRALAAARAAAARRTRLRQEGVMAPEETLGIAADGTHSGDDPHATGQGGLREATEADLTDDPEPVPTSTATMTSTTLGDLAASMTAGW